MIALLSISPFQKIEKTNKFYEICRRPYEASFFFFLFFIYFFSLLDIVLLLLNLTPE